MSGRGQGITHGSSPPPMYGIGILTVNLLLLCRDFAIHVWSPQRVGPNSVVRCIRYNGLGLREMFKKFIEAQTKMSAHAHAKTVAVQNLPPLTPFTGEEIDVNINHLLSGMKDLKSVHP